MKSNKNFPKVSNNFQEVWNTFKDQHSTEGYYLTKVFDIYLPFWKCKQNVVIEKDIELDRFSRILLELISKGITTHSELCLFLGIGEDSFPTIQFHFLLKQDLICEFEVGYYEITHQGINFLSNKTKLKNIESIEFEYFITEKLNYLQNDLTQDFFDPTLPIDKHLSEGLKKSFRGYQVMQSHKLNQSKNSKIIEHNKAHRPTFNKVSSDRNEFSSFFNSKFKEGVFYDFADPNIEIHKRTICFYGLLYEHKDDYEDVLMDIRHSPKSINSFNGKNKLEEMLSKKATEYVLKNELN